MYEGAQRLRCAPSFLISYISYNSLNMPLYLERSLMTTLDSLQATISNTQKGREALQDWEASKRHNAYNADKNLQAVLKFYLGERYEAFEPHLQALGEHVYTTL